jgi:uncharacterized Zn finger protein
MSDRHIEFPCPKCHSSAVFYLAEDWLESEKNPVPVPPFAYCENCGHETEKIKIYVNRLGKTDEEIMREEGVA